MLKLTFEKDVENLIRVEGAILNFIYDYKGFDWSKQQQKDVYNDMSNK